jgi:hypothetical protein
MHADFYFGIAPAVSDAAAGEKAIIVKDKQLIRNSPRFNVRGRDGRTGSEVVFQSNARSEALAISAAVALGLEAASIKAEPILERAHTTDEIPGDAQT